MGVSDGLGLGGRQSGVLMLHRTAAVACEL
jgi:hypothetical protein